MQKLINQYSNNSFSCDWWSRDSAMLMYVIQVDHAVALFVGLQTSSVRRVHVCRMS